MRQFLPPHQGLRARAGQGGLGSSWSGGSSQVTQLEAGRCLTLPQCSGRRCPSQGAAAAPTSEAWQMQLCSFLACSRCRVETHQVKQASSTSEVVMAGV